MTIEIDNIELANILDENDNLKNLILNYKTKLEKLENRNIKLEKRIKELEKSCKDYNNEINILIHCR